MKVVNRVGRYIFWTALVSVTVGAVLVWNDSGGKRRVSAVTSNVSVLALPNHEYSEGHGNQGASGKMAQVTSPPKPSDDLANPVSTDEQFQRDFRITNAHEKFLSEQVLRLNDDKGAIYVATVLAIVRGNVEEIEWFLGSGVNPNAEVHIGFGSAGTYSDRSLLEFAVESNQVDAAAALIKAGADVNRISNEGSLPLELAAGSGETKMVSLLLDHGAELDRSGSIGMTPLRLAATGGHDGTAELLLARGASVAAALGPGRILPEVLADPPSEKYVRTRDLMIANGAVMPSGSATRP